VVGIVEKLASKLIEREGEGCVRYLPLVGVESVPDVFEANEDLVALHREYLVLD